MKCSLQLGFVKPINILYFFLLFSVLHTILLSLYILYHLNQFCSAPLVTSKLFDSLFLPKLKFSFVLANYDIRLNPYRTWSSERLREAFRIKKLKSMPYSHLMRTLSIQFYQFMYSTWANLSMVNP